MKLEELVELHYITPIANIPSIYTHGILSHKMTQKLEHESISMQEIQERRAQVVVPGGRPLHEYVNLYFDARNPMMFLRKAAHLDLCVLRIAPSVLNIPGVVITDRNASSGYALFKPAPQGLAIVDKELVFAKDWTHPDQIEYWNRKSAKNAEVLVPDRVDWRFILGAYVSCPESEEVLVKTKDNTTIIDIVVNGQLFFR